MAEFIGKGKIIKWDNIIGSICLDDIPDKSKVESRNGKTYVNIFIGKKKEKDQWGNTHYIKINEFKHRENNQSELSATIKQPEKKSDEILDPFNANSDEDAIF